MAELLGHRVRERGGGQRGAVEPDRHPIAIGALRIPGIRFIADAVYQWVATHVIVFPERRRTVSHTPALADGSCEGQLTNPRYFLPSCSEIGSSRSG